MIATPAEERVLILTPTGQDAEITQSVLAGAQIDCVTCRSLLELCHEVELGGAGAALITEEVMTSPDLISLTGVLQRQPPWSELPLLVLTYGGVDSPGAEMALQTLGNVTLLERPVRVTTLVSAVRSALAARRRQYEIREHLREREVRESELRASREQLRLMVESLTDYALFTLDPAGIVSSWNPGAETVFGYSESEIIGQPGTLLFTPEDRTERAPEMEMQTARERGQAADERWHLRKDGRRFFASGMLTPIRDASGALLGYTKVARDITDRKRAEDALREADRQKDEFLAMLAHELRNPLAPISNAIHIMKARPDREHGERARNLVERQVRHLTRLVDDLLDISRITTGKIQLRTTEVNLSGIVARAIEDVRPLLDSKGHRLRVRLSPEPMYLEADPTRLEQLFSNLLNNAVKYTEAGGEITVVSERRNGSAVVSIRDTGAGISPELLPEVFKLFRQADRTLARSEGGLGIGLTVVKRLVELHGGEVWADSEGLGKGSTFSVRLPLLEMPALHGACTNADAASEALPPEACRVLVVDDNQDMLESLVDLLELSGCETRQANNGAAALEALRDFHPTAMLLDIGLPGKDGYQIAREVRQMKFASPITLIALSGYGRRQDMDLSREAGFDHHLVKPVEFDELLKLIRVRPQLQASQ